MARAPVKAWKALGKAKELIAKIIRRVKEIRAARKAARDKLHAASDAILTADRKGSALKMDRHHLSSQFLTKKQLRRGQVFDTKGGDGSVRTLLQTKGAVNGEKGIFEFIIDTDGLISHQRFIPGGKITGVPNQMAK